MADTDRIKRNLGKMIDAGAPEADLNAYLATEGFDSPEAWRSAIAQPAQPAPAASPAVKPVGAAMAVPQRPPQIQAPPVPDDTASRIAMESPGAALPNARPDTSGRFIAPPPPAAPAPQGRTWADVPGEALKNLPASAGNFLQALVQPIIHPVDTAKGLVALGDAVGSKISRPGNLLRVGDPEPTPEQLKARATREAPADAVGQFFSERYGSTEGLKNTLATDPVGFAADLSTVLTGGSMLPVRGAATLGKAAAAVDPLTQAGNVLKLGGKGAEAVASNALGMTTGAGAESIRAAGRAGKEGGEAAKAFTANMRGDVPVESIVDMAKSGLEKIRQERGAAYRAGKVDLSKDKTIIPFDDIDTAIGKASEVGSFQGVNINRPAGKTMDEISSIVSEWKGLDPAVYHTPEGLDALKRSIGAVRDSTEYGTPARVAADRVYNAVKAEIEAQAPAYAKMMEDYARSSDKIKEVTKTFSLGEKATGDTAARKLQAATRDGAQTSWRNRGELLNELSVYEPGLPYAISGQSLNALPPRGLVGRGAAMAMGAGAVANPLNLMALPAFSPRIVGETVYLGGKAAGKIDDVAEALGVDAAAIRAAAQASFQTGRATQPNMLRVQ